MPAMGVSMPYRRRAPEPGRSLCFDIGRHLVRLERQPEGWTASVDGLALGSHYATSAQAWEHGVRAARAIEIRSPPIADAGQREGAPEAASGSPDRPDALGVREG
jgi:hypothetical protein